MLKINQEKLLANVQGAATDDLLDRITVHRAGMEPVALEIIENELQMRGVTSEQIVERERCYEGVLRDASGMARLCAKCQRPAVEERVTWHRLLGILPLFRYRAGYCDEHAATAQSDSNHPTD